MGNSLKMAGLAAGDGVVAIAATPHLYALDAAIMAKMGEGREELSRSLISRTPDLELVGGYEVSLSLVTDCPPETLASLAIAGGKYLLVESADTTADQIARAVFNVRMAGLYPVLAHPERSLDMRRERSSLEALVANGDIFMQLTAASVEGAFGRRTQRLCRDLLLAGAAHLVASDAHDPVHRPPLLSGSCAVLERDFGQEAAATIMHDNPWRIINGGRLAAAGPPGRRRRVFLGL